MTIEVQRPELESLIEERMASGQFASVEEVLLHALQATSSPVTAPPQKKNFVDFIMESPLAGADIEFERIRDYPEPIKL